MESLEYQDVVSKEDVKRFPISITTTEVNLTGSWRFMKPVAREKISPCSIGCPANTNIPRYINHFLKGEIKKAVEILRNENPFPATCGRVCPHFCQLKCNRANYDGSVEIREIEKFIGDYGLDIPYEKPKIKNNKKVAVIGGGPAGLSCAYFLAKNGFSVKIFEKEGKLGGLPMFGIPEYRLPKNIIEKEIENIIAMENIEVELNRAVDELEIENLKKSFDAVFVAIGLTGVYIPENINIDGVNILSGYDFLRDLNSKRLNREFLKGSSILVVGGGNAAFDVARVALRLGSNVEMVYLEALAFDEEKIEAAEEGLKIKGQMVVDRISKEDRLFVRLREVEAVDGSNFVLGKKTEEVVVDKVIVATGQRRGFEFKGGDNVFIGGDYAHGAKSVIEAIASGKQSAYEIMEYLIGVFEQQPFVNDDFVRAQKDFDIFKVVEFEKINLFYFPKEAPVTVKKLPPDVRNKNFEEVTQKVPMDELLKEAKRCFSCGVCNQCKTCWFYCPDVCIDVQGKVEFDYDYCKGCGVCSVECPRGVIELVEDK